MKPGALEDKVPRCRYVVIPVGSCGGRQRGTLSSGNQAVEHQCQGKSRGEERQERRHNQRADNHDARQRRGGATRCFKDRKHKGGTLSGCRPPRGRRGFVYHILILRYVDI